FGFNNGNRDGLPVAGSAARTAQDLWRSVVGTIDDDGLETLAGQLPQSSFRTGTQFDSDVEIAKRAAKQADDFFVRAQHQRFQSHSWAIPEFCSRSGPSYLNSKHFGGADQRLQRLGGLRA